MYKQLNAAQTAEKYQKNVSRSKQRAAQVQQDKEIGITSKKGSPVKSVKGASKGGQLKKKIRQTAVLQKELINEGQEGEESK